MRIRKVFKGLYLILVFYLLLIPVVVSAEKIDVDWAEDKFLGIKIDGIYIDDSTGKKKSILTNSYRLDDDSTNVVDTDTVSKLSKVIEQALKKEDNILEIYNACKGTGLGSFGTDGLSVYAYRKGGTWTNSNITITDNVGWLDKNGYRNGGKYDGETIRDAISSAGFVINDNKKVYLVVSRAYFPENNTENIHGIQIYCLPLKAGTYKTVDEYVVIFANSFDIILKNDGGKLVNVGIKEDKLENLISSCKVSENSDYAIVSAEGNDGNFLKQRLIAKGLGNTMTLQANKNDSIPKYVSKDKDRIEYTEHYTSKIENVQYKEGYGIGEYYTYVSMSEASSYITIDWDDFVENVKGQITIGSQDKLKFKDEKDEGSESLIELFNKHPDIKGELGEYKAEADGYKKNEFKEGSYTYRIGSTSFRYKKDKKITCMFGAYYKGNEIVRINFKFLDILVITGVKSVDGYTKGDVLTGITVEYELSNGKTTKETYPLATVYSEKNGVWYRHYESWRQPWVGEGIQSTTYFDKLHNDTSSTNANHASFSFVLGDTYDYKWSEKLDKMKFSVVGYSIMSIPRFEVSDNSNGKIIKYFYEMASKYKDNEDAIIKLLETDGINKFYSLQLDLSGNKDLTPKNLTSEFKSKNGSKINSKLYAIPIDSSVVDDDISFNEDGYATNLTKSDIFTMLESYYGAKSYSKVFTPDNRKLSYIASDVLWSKFYGRSAYSSDVSDHAQVFVLGDKQLNGYNTYAPAFSPVSSNGEYSGAVPIGVLLSKGNGSYSKASEVDKVDITNGNISDMRYYEGIPTSQLLTTTLNTKTRYIKSKISKDTEFSAKAVPLLDYSDKLDKNDFLNIKISDCHKEWKSGYVSEYTGETYETIRDIIENADICALIEVLSGQPGFNENTKAVDYNYKSKGEQRNTFSFYADYILGMDKTKTNNFRKKAVEFLTSFGGENSSKDLGLLNESGLINGKNNYDIEAVQTNYEDYLYSSVKKVGDLNENYRKLVADLLPSTDKDADISGKSYEAVRQMYYLLQVFSLNSSIASLQFDEELKFEEKGNKPLGKDGNVWDDGLKDAGRAVDIYYQFVTQLKSSTSVDRKSISCYQIEPVIGIKSPYESDRLVICNLQELQVFTHNKITGKVDVNPNGKGNWTTSVLTIAKVSEAFDLPISNKQAYKKISGNGLDGTVKMNPNNENVYKLQKYLYDGTYGKVEDSKENLTVGSWTIKQSKLSSQIWKAIGDLDKDNKLGEHNRWINTIGYNTIKEYLDKLVKLAGAYNTNEYDNISYLWVNSPFFLQTVDNKIEDYIPFINVYKTWGQGVGGEGNKEFTNSFENAYITALPMWADSPSARKKIIDEVKTFDKMVDPTLLGSYNDSINYLNDYYRALKDIIGSEGGYDVLNKFLLGNYSYNRFVTVLRGSLDGIAYNTDSSNLTSSTYGDDIKDTAKKQNKYYWLRAPLLGSKSFYLQADIDKTRFYQAVSTPWTVLMSNILGQIKIDPASGNNEIDNIKELKDNMAKVNAYGYYQELMQGTESLSDNTLSSLGISNTLGTPQKGNYVARMNALAIREYSPDENTEKIQKADKGKTDNPFSIWTFENNKKSLCELMYTPADRSVAGTLAAYVNSLSDTQEGNQENTKEYFTDLADRWYGNTVFYKEEYSKKEDNYDKHASTGTIQGYLLIGAGVTAPSNPKLSLKTTISSNYKESTVEVGESTLTKGLPENSSTTGKGWTWEEGYNVGTDINKSPTLIAGFRYTGTEDELADFFGQSATGEDYNAAEDNNSEYDVYVSITRKIDDEDINKLVSKNWATSTNIRLFPITSSEYADGTRKLPWTAMQASISQFSTAKLEEQLKVLKNKFGTSPAYSTIKGFTCNGINIEANKSIGSVQFSDSSKKFLYSFTKVIDKNEDRTEDDTSGRWITFRGDDVKELYKWLLGKTTSNKYSVLKYIDTFTSLNTIQKKKSVLGDSFTINYELNWKIRKREVVLKDNEVAETNIVSVQSAEPTKCKVRYKFTQGTAPMYVNVKATPNYKLGWGTNPLKSTVKLGTLNKTEGSGNCEDVSIRVDVSDNDTSTRLTKLIKSLKKDHNVTKNSKLKFKVKYKLTKKGIEATNAKPEDKDTLVKTPEAVAEASTIKDKLIKSFSTETEFTYKEFCILHRLFDYKDKSIKWSRVRFTDKISELPVKLNKYIGTLVNSYQAVQTSLIITYDGTQIYKNKEPYEAEDTEQVEIFESGVPYQDLVIKNNEVKVDDKLQKANKLTSQDATTTIEDEYNPVLFAEISHKNSSNTQLSNDIENLPDSQRIQLKITIKRPSIEQENVEIIENKAAKINYLETIEEQGLDKFDEDDSYTQVKNGVIIKTSIGAFKKLVLGNGKPVFTFTDSSVSDLRYSKSTEVDEDEACKITLNYRMEVTYSLDNGKTFKTFIPDDGEAKVEYTLSNENEPYKVYEKTVDIPKAWAELKNTKGYADTQNYEAMNGVTTDQLLYFTAGGSEYLYHIDIYADQNYWAKRNYKITWEKFQTDDALEEQDAPATGVKNKSGSAGKTHLNELLQKSVEEKTSEVFHGSTLDEAQKTEQQAKENLCEKLDMHSKMEEMNINQVKYYT